ncbi:MAG: PIN domain-containing protein [Deltaproteobacteria bacterium]|nr:PIN domain-containing protein [Deltaproteobacteria bacterium]
MISNATVRIFISCITKIELLCFETDDKDAIKGINDFLKEIEILYIDDEIIDRAVIYRRHHKFKVPDAIIAATAAARELTLVSADKAFQKISDIKLISPL